VEVVVVELKISITLETQAELQHRRFHLVQQQNMDFVAEQVVQQLLALAVVAVVRAV
jgi:hypothetical protein